MYLARVELLCSGLQTQHDAKNWLAETPPIRRQRYWRVTTGAAPATPPIASCRDSSDRISKQPLVRLLASGNCRRHYAIAFSQAGVVAVVPAKTTVI